MTYDVVPSLTATITVQEPATPASPYELYYTLDSTTDTDATPDKYMEYTNKTDTVTAEIYLRATSAEAAAKNLQAFDLYVQNNEDLHRETAVCPTVGGSVIGAIIDNDSYTNTSTDTVTHIQAIGSDPEKPINVEIPYDASNNVGVKIATITYSFKDSAVYNTGLPITILDASNIAIEGTVASFTPMRSDAILGAELMQTYTVTYLNGVGDTDQSDAAAGVSGMPVPPTATKEHNVALTLTGTVTDGDGIPSRPGYTFLGWDETKNKDGAPTYALQAAGNDQHQMAANVNRNVTLYAQWSQDTYWVKWWNLNNAVGSQLLEEDTGADAYIYNATPSYNGSTPEKTATDAITYVFAGWSEDPDDSYTAAQQASDLRVTKNTDYYAIFQETPHMYPVHYDLNGHGTSGAITDQSVAYNTTTTAPAAPSDPNYAFGGWYKEAACTNAWDFDNDKVLQEETLFAKWTPNTYTLNLDEKCTDYTYVSPYTEPTTYTYGAEDALPTAEQIIRPGYTFAGWYKDAGLSDGPYTNVPLAATGTQTYYAKWTPLTYKVAFNANGAQNGSTAGMDPVAFGTAQALTANGFTYTYTVGGQTKSYTFSGWSATAKAVGAAPDYTAPFTTAITDALFVSQNHSEGDTITLYATWSQDDYAITYVLGENGVNGTDNPPTYNVDHLPITLNNPSRPGYTFTGWTATKTGSDPAEVVALTGGNQIPAGTTGDLTLTAAWQKIPYEITFVEDGGSNVGDANHKMSYDIESEATLPVTTKTGYTFQHWLLTNGGSVAQNWGTVDTSTAAEEASVKGKFGNVELTAIWQAKTAELSFDPKQDDDHIGTLDPNDPIDVTYDGTYPTLPTPTPPIGYDFAGWYIGNVKIKAGDTVAISEDTTAVAHYTLHNYNITFEEVGGAAVTDLTYTITDTSVTIPSTSKVHYDFLGWAVTSDQYNRWGADTIPAGEKDLSVADFYGDVTLTAQWELTTYTITYHENGGEYEGGYTAPTSYRFGDTKTLPTAANIKKPGYTFGGWYANKGLTGDQVTGIADTDDGNKEFWAMWTPTPYTITLELDGGSVTGSNPIAYNIETAFTLPTPEKANCRFDGWKLKELDETCTAWGTAGTTVLGAETYNDGTKTFYGNVTLTAQWTVTLTAAVEVYKYADENYVMLRVKDDLDNEARSYKWNNQDMFWTDDASYKFAAADDGVFYTLIPVASFVSNYDAEHPDNALALTDAGYAKISSGDNTGESRATITYNGDVNGDGTVNIADANAVYQMVRSTGKYYAGQLTDAQRLAADMDKTATGAEYRGSIKDVNAIVDIVNEKKS